MPTYRQSHNAFSLFEAIVCIIILGVIGIICSSMLLQISKNISYTKAISDSSPYIALLKIENILQYAIIESLQSNGAPLNAPSSNISFSSLQESLLFGGGVKNSLQEVQNDTLLPTLSLVIDSHYDKILYFKPLKGWQTSQKAYLITQPKESFKPYSIARIHDDIIYLDRKPLHSPHLILPIQNHTLTLHDNILWLDNAPLINDVSSFIITPISSTQGTFLEMQLCVKAPIKNHCENGGVWLDEIVVWQ